MGNDDDTLTKMGILSQEDPDRCLATISSIFERDESLRSNPIFRFYRGIAYMQKAVDLSQSRDNQWDDVSLDLLEQSLTELRVASDLEAEGPDLTKGKIGEKIDAAATALESFRPGRDQELLGKTKLKYFGDRGMIAQKAKLGELGLTLSDEAMNIFANIFFSFPHIIKSAVVVYMVKDNRQRHYVTVALFEETSPANPFGEFNPIRGYVNLYEDGTFDLEEPSKDEAKKKEPEKKGFFKKLFG